MLSTEQKNCKERFFERILTFHAEIAENFAGTTEIRPFRSASSWVFHGSQSANAEANVFPVPSKFWKLFDKINQITNVISKIRTRYFVRAEQFCGHASVILL